MTHPLEVHAFHSLIHSLYNGSHIARYLSHRHGSFDSASDCVYPARKAEKIECFALLADGIRGVDPCTVVIALLQGLLNIRYRITDSQRTYFL